MPGLPSSASFDPVPVRQPAQGRTLWSNAANFVVFQAGWLVCVFGAARGLGGWAAVIGAAIVAGHLALVDTRRRELRVVMLALLAGLLLDGAFGASGLIDYRDPSPLRWLAPPWILALWALFAITLDHSMRWLAGRYWLAALFGAVGGPLSFLAGQRIGALELRRPELTLALLALAWALITPGLLHAARSAAPAGGQPR